MKNTLKREITTTAIDQVAFKELTGAAKVLPFSKIDLVSLAVLHLVRDHTAAEMMAFWGKHMIGVKCSDSGKEVAS